MHETNLHETVHPAAPYNLASQFPQQNAKNQPLTALLRAKQKPILKIRA